MTCNLRGCGRPGSAGACARCRRVAYCSPEHERIDWTDHHHHVLCALWTSEFAEDFTEVARANEAFRCVVETNTYSQYVAMTLQAQQNIGEEVHGNADQQLVVVDGVARVKRDKRLELFHSGQIISIKAGTSHDVTNASQLHVLKLLTVYNPPMHRPNAVHMTKEDALREEAASGGS